MKAFYCDHFVLPLPVGHRFPMAKYALVREWILGQGILHTSDLAVPDPVSDSQVCLVHTPSYVRSVVDGRLTDSEQRRIGFPWSPSLVERSRRSAGGTLAACRASLGDRVAVNLAGGTHHAFSDRGEGFCVFNDAAIAARVLQREGLVRNVLVVDCDVHQGNGTAAIFKNDSTVFTFSMHGHNNYPFRKEQSDLDVALDDGAEDGPYLAALKEHLEIVCVNRQFDLAIYVSGADPFVGDTLGRLSLSKQGLSERDRFVLHYLVSREIPVAVVMAGGYAKDTEDTVGIHVATVSAAAAASHHLGRLPQI